MTGLKTMFGSAGLRVIKTALAAHAYSGSPGVAREAPDTEITAGNAGYGAPQAAQPMAPAELDAVRGAGEPPLHGFRSDGSISFETNLTGSTTF